MLKTFTHIKNKTLLDSLKALKLLKEQVPNFNFCKVRAMDMFVYIYQGCSKSCRYCSSKHILRNSLYLDVSLKGNTLETVQSHFKGCER